MIFEEMVQGTKAHNGNWVASHSPSAAGAEDLEGVPWVLPRVERRDIQGEKGRWLAGRKQ